MYVASPVWPAPLEVLTRAMSTELYLRIVLMRLLGRMTYIEALPILVMNTVLESVLY